MSEMTQMILLLVVLPAVLALGSLGATAALFWTRDAQKPSTPRTIATVILGCVGLLLLVGALGTGACFGYVATLR